MIAVIVTKKKSLNSSQNSLIHLIGYYKKALRSQNIITQKETEYVIQ